LLETSLLGLQNRIPKQKWHTREMMIFLVGTAILIHHGTEVAQRQDRGYGNSTFADQPDLKVGAHAGNQVPEPGARLGEKPMTPSGDHLQPVEIIEKALRAAFFVRKMLALGPPNAALEAALVQALE